MFLKYWMKFLIMEIQKNRKESDEWIKEKWLNEWTNWREKFCFLKISEIKIWNRKKKEKQWHSTSTYVIYNNELLSLSLSLLLYLFSVIFLFPIFDQKKEKKRISEAYPSQHLLFCILSLYILLFLHTPTHIKKKKFPLTTRNREKKRYYAFSLLSLP